ncbi:ankyrin repeat domain-containing protein 10-like [Trachinotus anak]|uniref:ankyrin repeat domain-containing protein 10-like n=1 Tax=Trachinotus anak TaxID=443729 RepID=UPI0039F16DDA
MLNLMFITGKTQLECVVHLVQLGCQVNSVTSRFNQTPTHTAAFGGHPHCVVWLTQAGADVNRQDFAGEAPIHKAARSGSLECIQVLLIAGAKPHLRNTSGQTAADLARAHGFLDCSRFIFSAQKQLQQLSALHEGGDAPCGQRKRLLTVVESGLEKRARRGDNVLLQKHLSAGEEEESMTVELSSGETLTSSHLRRSASSTASLFMLSSKADDHSRAFITGHHHTRPCAAQSEPVPPPHLSSATPPTANQLAAAGSTRRSSADMCGSLHLSGSPSTCVSQRPAWGGLMGADPGDFQFYGHYHGFGDTAEELSDGRHRWAVVGSAHLHHSS